MPRYSNQLPDLDLLDSPLMSPPLLPFRVPGSALAERIFNDPDSWQPTSADDSDLDDPMAWLADEMEKYHASGEQLALSPIDHRDSFASLFKPFDNSDPNKQPFLPLFKHTSLDLSLNMDLRLSKIWDSKQAKRASSVTTNSNSSGGNNSHPPPPLNLDSKLSPMLSPPVASASATWSILELYGVSTPVPTPPPPTPPRKLSSSFPSNSSSSTTAPSTTTTTTTLDPATATPIRRLPVIPPSSQQSSPPSRSTTPPSPFPPTKIPSSPPPPQRSKSEPLTTTLHCSHNPRLKTPLPPATLTRTASASDLAATASKHKNSPSVLVTTNIPNSASPQIVRSPPIGPRPRSGTTPVKKKHSRLQLRNVSVGSLGSDPFVVTPPPPPLVKAASFSKATGLSAAAASGGSIGRSHPRPMPTLPASFVLETAV